MLRLEGLRASYGPIEALRGLDLAVREGELVCLLGANGAGKSSTLRAISGLLPARAGPILADRRRQAAGTLSGGEQQMLAIGRALMARPRLIMFDEPSLGLAPTIVETTFAIIADIRRAGTTVLMVEQNARLALRMADRGYVMEAGRIVLAGSARELLH